MKKQINNTRKLCTIAMLLAVAVVLGMFSLRIGAGIKISFKFTSVFLTSALFGPVYGGLCGILSDILAYFVNPGVGPYMPQIGLVEALYGISYGLFFFKSYSVNTKNIIKLIICLMLNTSLLSILAMAYFLKDLMGMTYINTVIFRIPSSALNMLMHFAGIIVILKFIPKFKKLSGIE